jgi:hypothetical protein
MNTRTFMVFDIHARKNKIRDEKYFEIEMLDDITGEYVKTYASEENFNFDHWLPIIEAWQPNTLVAITGLFRFTRNSKTKQLQNIVNADSKPHILETYNQDVRDQYLNIYAKKYL